MAVQALATKMLRLSQFDNSAIPIPTKKMQTIGQLTGARFTLPQALATGFGMSTISSSSSHTWSVRQLSQYPVQAH
jgi:hypothetical protein